jgi:hypothetical protein
VHICELSGDCVMLKGPEGEERVSSDIGNW